MNKQIKVILQYTAMAVIATLLLYLALGSIEAGEDQTRLQFILSVWKTSDKTFLVISGLLAILSHLIRAERWKLLLKPAGHQMNLTQSFVSVMVGYFVNLAIPRGGELSRCYNLYRINGTPIDVSFGTVLAERVIDLVILLSLIGFSFIIEWDQLTYFFSQLDLSLSGDTIGTLEKIGIAVVIIGGGVLFFFLLTKMFPVPTSRLRQKIRETLGGLKKGLMTIFTLKGRVLFLLYSLSIWVLYYLMSYFIILAFPETSGLGLLDTLTIFVIGGIAMAIPLPGGTGSYHVLVPLGLVTLFGIARDEAVAFSFIFHGWQTMIVILVGIISLLYTQVMVRKNKL